MKIKVGNHIKNIKVEVSAETVLNVTILLGKLPNFVINVVPSSTLKIKTTIPHIRQNINKFKNLNKDIKEIKHQNIQIKIKSDKFSKTNLMTDNTCIKREKSL